MKKIKLKNIYGKNVTISLVKYQNKADFITHSGTFHADEVMATVFLINKFGSIKLARVNDVTNKDAFVYDIGFGKFDHHGLDFDLRRDNGIKYAACGLVWKEFGTDIISKLNVKNVKEIVNNIEKNLVMDIDRDDNGESLGVELPVKMQNIPSLISFFNPAWDETYKEEDNFLEAVNFCNDIFNNIISKMYAKEKARSIIEDAIDKSSDSILVLDNYMPWKDIVLTSNNKKAKDILYAVFPSKRGGYNVVATPLSQGSFECKKPFPKKWGGLSKEDLRKESGVETINFCHVGLFICACDTLDDAIKIAEIAVKDSVNK